MRWPRQKSLEKFKESIRQKTQRTRSGSMKQIIEETNRTLRGWFNYFQHSIENIFERLDRWTRGRLRNMCADVTNVRVGRVDRIITAGQMPISRNSG